MDIQFLDAPDAPDEPVKQAILDPLLAFNLQAGPAPAFRSFAFVLRVRTGGPQAGSAAVRPTIGR